MARAEAMSIAGVNRPEGKGYNMAMSAILKEYGLDDMEGTARKDLFEIMDRFVDIEAWRLKQKDPGRLNHPTTVWRGFGRSSKAQDERDKAKRSPRENG